MKKGRTLLGLAIAVMLGGLIIWVVIRSNINRTPQSTVGWKPVKLTSSKLSFLAPPSWAVSEDTSGTNKNPQSIILISPSSKGYYFSLEASSGLANDIYGKFLGGGNGQRLLDLPAPGSKTKLYLVSQLDKAKKATTGLSLATTPGGDKTSFGIVDKNKPGDNNITMSVNLLGPIATPEPLPYPLKTYQSQPEYKNVLEIFKSLSFER